jgi:hypothetical protein
MTREVSTNLSHWNGTYNESTSRSANSYQNMRHYPGLLQQQQQQLPSLQEQQRQQLNKQQMQLYQSGDSMLNQEIILPIGLSLKLDDEELLNAFQLMLTRKGLRFQTINANEEDQ